MLPIMVYKNPAIERKGGVELIRNVYHTFENLGSMKKHGLVRPKELKKIVFEVKDIKALCYTFVFRCGNTSQNNPSYLTISFARVSSRMLFSNADMH